MAEVIQLFKGSTELTKMQRFHALWEDVFAKYGQSLTDPDTAQSLRAAIAMMDILLDGACATGMLNEEQRDDLRAAMHVGLSAADEFQNL